MRQEIDTLRPIPVGRVEPSGFIYHIELGRVECAKCGHRAFSRNLVAVRIWELAHAKCCRLRAESAEPRCA